MLKPTSVRLDEETIARLMALAAATDRPRTWHIEEALRRYLDEELQFLAAVDEGVRDLEGGAVVDHAVVVEETRRRLAGGRADRP